ncbi:IS5 family transposase [Streptosporangium sp. NPDC006007]|uniref:IS5 family transposase n=1 Tax=Streptosporangium sp. NPDC006007 TaxID=3154575 RepID=UPI00339F4ED2
MDAFLQRLVPDELWELFQRVVPPAPARPQGGGRRRVNDRVILAAIVYVATTGCAWRQLPPVFGASWQTVNRRFAEWSTSRVWAKLYRLLLDELGARGELDWSRCAIGSVSVRAVKGGPLTGPSPVDRGKKGSKIHLITERTGLPLAIAISAAGTHDSLALQPLIRSIPPIRSRREPRRRRPAKLHGDKGYDYPHLRIFLRSRGIVSRIARRGIESGHRLGRHRWVVERVRREALVDRVEVRNLHQLAVVAGG